MAPPVAPKPKLLPFHDPSFSWETFESFFCDFLAAHPELLTKDAKSCRVVSAHPYGRRGDSQHGIDIRVEMSNGEVWVFQCKHYKEWGPKKTSTAITKCSYNADRKFLLVTRSVSPETREVVAKHPDWELWDSGDISREFLQRLPSADAARILYANFGRGWPEELLGISGSSPLVTGDAKFAPLLKPDRSFHHRLAMIGRRELLQDLDAFVADEKTRVFFLVGAGGIGKSRLLYEWSREFAQRHKGWTLRFVSDSPGDFATALDATAKPLILGFDDAHRLDDVRRALLAQLPGRENIKLILALRPGPTDQIESELIESGFDTTHIRRPRPMKRLSSEQALELAEAALGPSLAGRYRLPLHSLSRDIPLLAILAAELLKRGELAEKALTDTDEFRTHVFEGLLRESRAVEERFGATRTRDLLRLLAVLAPVRMDTEFLKRTAALLNDGTQPNNVSDILSALDNAGLILTTGAGIRVSPDLLSDHLAYTACYDKRGRNTAFAERVMEHFPPDQFPRFLQHVAEAEWRALKQTESPDSIVEPLWQAFVAQFEACSFYARGEKLKTWANIAHLQPERTLALADLALRLKTAPPDANQWVRTERWDSHATVLEPLPALVKPLAIHHPEHVAAVLDILWQLGRDQPAPHFNSRGHPITTIGEIAGFQLHKQWAVNDEALQWLERLYRGDEWIGRKNPPGWILQQTLKPLFGLAVDESWQTGNTISWRTIPLPLDRTDKYRDGALSIIRAITKRGLVPVTLATLNVIQHAMRFAYLGIATVTDQYRERWLVERKKAFALLAEIVRESTSALIRFRARRMLLMEMRYKNTDLRSASREMLKTIPETSETRLVRAVLGSYWDEFESRGENWQEHAKRRWTQFINSVAEEIVSRSQNASKLLEYLGSAHTELTDLGAQPNFWLVLNPIAERHPDLALAVANELLRQPRHPLGPALDALVVPTTANDLEVRMRICEAAMAAGCDELLVGAIASFTSWRQEGELPARAWELLCSCASTATPWVANAIIRFVWLTGSKPASDDWRLLSALPTDQDSGFVARGIMERASHLIEDGLLPTPEEADAILGKLDELDSLSGHEIEHGLEQFAKHFPGKVFLLVSRRQARARETEENFEIVPFDFEHIRLDGVLSDSDAAEVVRRLEDPLLRGAEIRWDETRLLQIAILQSGDDVESRLLELVERADGDKQLLRLCEFVVLWDRWPVVLSCPQFTRALLIKAKATSEEIHRKLFRKLQGLPGSRGSSACQPDEEWKALLGVVEKLAEQYKEDAELGPLYAAATKHEREFMEDMCRRPSDEDDLLD